MAYSTSMHRFRSYVWGQARDETEVGQRCMLRAWPVRNLSLLDTGSCEPSPQYRAVAHGSQVRGSWLAVFGTGSDDMLRAFSRDLASKFSTTTVDG